jgi:hypothetical protein
MADLLFIVMMIAFFALAVGLVRICDRIIGADEDVVVGSVDQAPESEEIAA